VATLEVDGLSRTFGRGHDRVHALRDVGFRIDAGEIVGLLGLNGAGKTTLLKIVSTLLLPTEGTVRVAGHDVARETGAARRALSVVLGGERGLYNRLNAIDNMRFFGALSGLSRRDVDIRVSPSLERVGLGEAARRPVETYSRGMRQRLHLAIGLLATPQLLLLDEPTVGLDPIEAERVRESVAALRGSGTAVVLTSHHLGDIERAADRILILRRGRLTHDLPLERLLERAGAAAEVSLRGVGQPPAVPDAAAAGVRVLEVANRNGSGAWELRLEVVEWRRESLRELARVWPEGEVTDVRVRPVSLEHVFSQLAATET
jgi:ABC-2 type transport system ATP-binding protein